MKRIILLTICCLPVLAFAQGGKYVVEGKVGTYSAPAKVYLRYFDKSSTHLDSAVMDNGKFRFEGTVASDPIMAFLTMDEKGKGFSAAGARQVYLDNGTTTITGHSLENATIAGTQVNIDNAQRDKVLHDLDSYYFKLGKLQASSDEEKQTESYKKKEKEIEDVIKVKRAEIDKKFINEHADSYISLVVLGSFAYSADYSDIAPLFDVLTDRLKQTVRGKHFAELLPHIKAVAIGATAPEFTEADTSGKMVSLSSFRGKYTLVDFWASWCGPCRAENPNVIRAFNRYKAQNFTVLGVSLDASGGRGQWIAAINKDGLPWAQVSDLKSWDSEAAALYGVKAIPQNFLLDPNGKIIAKNLRGEELDAKLAEIFGKI